jgi:hypothetical protein
MTNNINFGNEVYKFKPTATREFYETVPAGYAIIQGAPRRKTPPRAYLLEVAI